MRVLVACEFSGAVRRAFRARGHDAWSCDLLPAEDDGEHIQGDVLEILEDGWDMMIAFPPCTYLCSSGLHWNKKYPDRDLKTHDAMMFVFNLMGEGSIVHNIARIALENPIGRIGTAYRKADQIIQPYEYGHNASKGTCLWLKGLPCLRPTHFIEPIYGCPKCRIRFPLKLGKYGCPGCSGEVPAKQVWGNQTPSGQNKYGPSISRAADRSRTFAGIADAMAAQWGQLLSFQHQQLGLGLLEAPR